MAGSGTSRDDNDDDRRQIERAAESGIKTVISLSKNRSSAVPRTDRRENRINRTTSYTGRFVVSSAGHDAAGYSTKTPTTIRSVINTNASYSGDIPTAGS